MLGNGTGEFDEERLLKQLPEALSLPEKRVRAAIQCALLSQTPGLAGLLAVA